MPGLRGCLTFLSSCINRFLVSLNLFSKPGTEFPPTIPMIANALKPIRAAQVSSRIQGDPEAAAASRASDKGTSGL